MSSLCLCIHCSTSDMSHAAECQCCLILMMNDRGGTNCKAVPLPTNTDCKAPYQEHNSLHKQALAGLSCNPNLRHLQHSVLQKGLIHMTCHTCVQRSSIHDLCLLKACSPPTADKIALACFSLSTGTGCFGKRRPGSDFLGIGCAQA